MTRGASVPLAVILAGVAAAVHVGKLPPAILALQQSLGIGLVEAGFLLSLVQFGGMTLGLAAGLLAEGVGLRRSLLAGLAVLTVAGLAGAWARDANSLLLLRAVEGVGLLLTTVPTPSLLRRCVRPAHLTRVLTGWSTYMPLGMALALLVGPWVIGGVGWRGWWVLTAGGTALMLAVIWRVVPADPPRARGGAERVPAPRLNWHQRLRSTLRAPAPWLGGFSFCVFALQWLSIIGFLPTLYAQLGWSGALASVLTAVATAVNVTGNLAAGRLLQRGVQPRTLLWVGFVATGVGGWLVFGPASTAAPVLSYCGALLFSSVGGLIPATLFSSMPRLAPNDGAIATTVGWIQQWASFGQVSGPPLVAWVAAKTGTWHSGGLLLAGFSVAGVLLAWQVHRHLRALPTRQPPR